MNFEEKDLAEYAEKDLKELLDTGTYAEALRELDLSALVEGGAPGGVVLHDRLIAEASFGIAPFFAGGPRGQNRAPIKDEHSYSLDSAIKEVEVEMSDLESECYPAISIAEAEGSRPHVKTDTQRENSASDAPESPNVLVSLSNVSSFTRCLEVEEGAKESVKDEKNDLRDGSPPLQRQPSMETLSCCGDCEGYKLEDELEDHSFSPPSPFSLIELPIQGERGDVLLTGPSRRGDRQRNRYHPYYRYHFGTPTSSLNPPSPRGISQKQEECEMYRSSIEESSATMIVTQNSTQALGTVPTTFQHEVQREEVHAASEGRVSFVAGPHRSIISKCRENGFVCPPTPPSCSGSDSESGGHSPRRKSPLYEQFSPSLCNLKRSANPTKTTTRNPIHTPLISSQPKGSTGSLHLTEEEKRTLISEGYPVPSQLPLSKAEEKSLKKIRRKIKNKISAQESRRKKKEYMDTLEHKVDMLSQENGSYRRKLESLQYRNQQLLQEVERLQNTDDKRRTRPNGRTMLFAS